MKQNLEFLVFQIIIIAADQNRWYSVADIGAGIWTALFFGVAGGVGMIATQRPSQCSVIAFMVLSIISSLFAVPFIVISGIGLGTADHRSSRNCKLIINLIISCTNF